MNSEYFKIVQAYVAKKTGIKENSLTPQTTIADLKIDGDDIKDLLLNFFKDYNIEGDYDELIEYLPKEGGFATSTLKGLYDYIRGKKPDKNLEDCIYLKDLEDALVNKKWNIKHCLENLRGIN